MPNIGMNEAGDKMATNPGNASPRGRNKKAGPFLKVKAGSTVVPIYRTEAHLLHRGAVGPVHLSENGFNSRDYSEKQLTDQAVGMAYAWNRIRDLDAIEVWH